MCHKALMLDNRYCKVHVPLYPDQVQVQSQEQEHQKHLEWKRISRSALLAECTKAPKGIEFVVWSTNNFTRTYANDGRFIVGSIVVVDDWVVSTTRPTISVENLALYCNPVSGARSQGRKLSFYKWIKIAVAGRPVETLKPDWVRAAHESRVRLWSKTAHCTHKWRPGNSHRLRIREDWTLKNFLSLLGDHFMTKYIIVQ
jgi:hypothetical protein